MMPLYIESAALLSGHLTGIGRFVARLIEALAPLTPLRLTTMISREQAAELKLSPLLRSGNDIPLSANDLPAPGIDLRDWVRHVLQLPQEAHDLGFSRRCPMLFTMLRPGVRHFAREACILYDFTPVVTPQFHTAATRESFGIFFSQATKLCDAAIAISESTRHDAKWLAGIDHDRVVVGYPGPSQCVHHHAFQGAAKRRKNLILVVATLEPRKNAQFVSDWFQRTSVLPEDMELVWVGPPGWLPALGDRKANKRIHFPGILSDAELCRLYQEATFTIYPSLYEGFGLPVLDSLLHGTPVACSFNSSLQEFDTPGVFYFDPCDPQSLDEACEDLLGCVGEVCVDIETLRQRFSWDRLARVVLEAVTVAAPVRCPSH